MQDIKEIRLQQEMFLWHWNTKQDQRGRLFMIHNTPQNEIQGALLKGAGMVRGIPDLMYLLTNGKYIFFEIKLQQGSQSKFQIWFEKVIGLLNGKYKVVRSLQEFQSWIVAQEAQETKITLPPYP